LIEGMSVAPKECRSVPRRRMILTGNIIVASSLVLLKLSPNMYEEELHFLSYYKVMGGK